MRALISLPDEFACCGDLRTQFGGLQDLDLAAFSEDPADDLVFERRFERDDEGAVGLRFDLELLHMLMLAQIERDGRVAAEADAADPGVHEETVPAGLLDELLVGNEGVSGERDVADALDRVDLDVLRFVLVPLDVPDAVAEREDVRLETAGGFRFVRLVVGQFDDLVHAPGVENFFEDVGIDRGLDAGGAEDGFDHGVVEEFGAVAGQRVFERRVRPGLDRFGQEIGGWRASLERDAELSMDMLKTSSFMRGTFSSQPGFSRK